MVETELKQLLTQIQDRQCEEQTIEVKSARGGCPEKLYDTLSSFSNQDSGGILVFGLDEKANFAKVGVYDAQDLQRRVMEYGEQMTPVVRPVFTVYEEAGKVFVSAEIPPVDITERPCFKTAKGRMLGSYIRVGDADKPMTEYEVYSYEAFRKKYRDDIRPVAQVGVRDLDQDRLAQYVLRRKQDRPHFATLELSQLYDLIGVTKNGDVTLAAVLLFSPYPQAYFPQLSIIATHVPGTEMGLLDEQGQRFYRQQAPGRNAAGNAGTGCRVRAQQYAGFHTHRPGDRAAHGSAGISAGRRTRNHFECAGPPGITASTRKECRSS